MLGSNFASNYAYWRAVRKRHKVREIDWNLLTTDVNYLFEENDRLWDRVSELSALVEFLVEKQEKPKKAPVARAKGTKSGTTKRA